MKKINILALLAALVLLLCGCGMSDDNFVQDGSAAVLILNNCANSNRYDTETIENSMHEVLERAVTRSIDSDGRYCVELNVDVIISDGIPTREKLVMDGTELWMTDDAPYAEKALERAEYLLEDFESFLLSDSLRAKDNGTNLVGAIEEAVRILKLSDAKEKCIYIYSSGIETEGVMAMGVDADQIDIQAGEVEDVIKQIGTLPNLEGIRVYFYGLGDVCVGQKDMRADANNQKKPGDISNFEQRLVDVWTAFFTASGVSPENLNDGKGLFMAPKGNSPMVSKASGGSYPDVRNVPFYEIIQEPAPNEQANTPSGALTLSAGELGGFKGDAATFNNPEQAAAALRSYYDYALKAVEEDPALKLYVVGSRAKTRLDWDNTHTVLNVLMDHDTSASRAIAVSNLITELFDIAPEQIVEIDAGTQRFTWSSPDEEYPDGVYIAEADEDDAFYARQAAHRVVTLIPATENNQNLIAELAHEQDINP